MNERRDIEITQKDGVIVVMYDGVQLHDVTDYALETSSSGELELTLTIACPDMDTRSILIGNTYCPLDS